MLVALKGTEPQTIVDGRLASISPFANGDQMSEFWSGANVRYAPGADLELASETGPSARSPRSKIACPRLTQGSLDESAGPVV